MPPERDACDRDAHAVWQAERVEPTLLHLPVSPTESGQFSPLAELLRERTTPELLHLEAKLAALVSYGATVDLLSDVLPLGDDPAVSSVHANVQ